ncbi:DUF6541 family protein [Halarchaeum sp. P4]|uniref:DUF6541 family protein n=1 Tax=Halarchaeum sp. P4 TaxID=3421639 RepID=UPI003EB7EF76
MPPSRSAERDANARTAADEQATTVASAARRRTVDISLLVGFLALAGGVLTAHRAPTHGYEVSVYAGTPTAFWGGVVAAVLLACLVLSVATRSFERRAALGLTGLAAAAFAALPLLRSYRFHGRYDPLTHLGWVKGVASGALDPGQLLYPAAHTLAVSLAAVGGAPLTRAMLVVVWLCALCFLCFVPLCVHLLTDDRRALAVGAVAALAVLPVNTLSTYLHFHPFSLATLVAPVFLYVLLAHLRRRHEDRTLPDSLAASSLALPVLGFGLVLLHPQLVTDLLVVLGAIATTQLLERHYVESPPDTRWLHAQFVLLGVVFLLWVSRYGATLDLLHDVVQQLRMLVGDVPARSAPQQTGGGGYDLPAALFVRLIGVSVVAFVVATGYVAVRSVAHTPWSSRIPPRDGVAHYFSIVGVALAGYLVVHILGGLTSYFFRHAGFVMLLVTILAAGGVVALSRRLDARIERRHVRGTLHTLGVVLAVVAVALSAATVFPSPYIYQPGQGVSDQQMTGYGTMFDARVAGAGVAGIASGPSRFADAHHERLDPELAWSLEADDLAGTLTTYHQGDYYNRSFYYLGVSRADYGREVAAYRGMRVPERLLDSVSGRPGLSRVYANGGLTYYYVEQPPSVLNASTRTASTGRSGTRTSENDTEVRR